MCNLYSSPESTYIYDVHEIYSQLAVLLSPLLSTSHPGRMADYNKQATDSSGIKGISTS